MRHAIRLILSFVLSIQGATSVAAEVDPSADDAARKAVGMMAGPAWEKARYFSFTFNAERDGKIAASFPQRWDRYTGDYRVSGKDKEGRDFDIIINTKTRAGRAWLAGVEVADPKELLERGYRRFINDTYWLLMPLKMLDPGVKRALEGSKREECGQTYDVVKLSFDSGVGLTSGDQYWAWVNRDSGIVDRWEMFLEGTPAGEKPSVVRFKKFERSGGLLISTRREIEGKTSAIRLDDLVVTSEVPANAFSR